jgi:hypothetical protein
MLADQARQIITSSFEKTASGNLGPGLLLVAHCVSRRRDKKGQEDAVYECLEMWKTGIWRPIVVDRAWMRRNKAGRKDCTSYLVFTSNGYELVSAETFCKKLCEWMPYCKTPEKREWIMEVFLKTLEDKYFDLCLEGQPCSNPYGG